MSTLFEQNSTTVVDGYNVYAWITADNWSNGIPANGANVVIDATVPGNPTGYDNIANLQLDTLIMDQGYLAVAGNLSVGTVDFAGSGFRVVFSDTLLSGSPASLTIDGIVGTGGYIQAIGAGAFTHVLAATDPGGEIYQATSGGVLEMAAKPDPTSSLWLDQGPGDTGTLAFDQGGGTISAGLWEIGVGASIELPGSSVSAVTFGASSLSIATNLGKTTFSNAHYLTGAYAPGGWTAAPDPLTGLEKITFTQTQADTFKQTSTTIVDGYPVYTWSNASNWSNGVPADGASVTMNISAFGNPSGYDDIANLSLDKLNLKDGYLAVAGDLTIGTLSVAGSGFRAAYSDTLLGGGTANLTIDGLSGTGAYIQAVGAGAVTDVMASKDPGEIYQTMDGGELVFAPTPNAASSFWLNQGGGAGDVGTIAFEKPGATVAAPLWQIGVGSSVELPGSEVSSVAFGSGTLAVTTDAGTTSFSSAHYLTGALAPGAWTASHDATTGLEKITFVQGLTTTFERNATTMVGGFPTYTWSNASNWTDGVPTNGSTVVVDSTAIDNPTGYDDVANLQLDALKVQQGYVGVAGNLTVGIVDFTGAGFRAAYSDTILSHAPASLTIGAITGGGPGVSVQAIGAGAVTRVLEPTDPGDLVYQTGWGGLLELAASPNSASQLWLNTGGGSGDVGTLAFEKGGSIGAGLYQIGVGSAIELPGSSVSAVTFGATSLSITTNLGKTTFSNAHYLTGNLAPTGWTASTDPLTGLEKITFIQGQTDNFEQTATTIVDGYPVYTWSNAANWSKGVPTDGASVTLNISAGGNPSGYDDIAHLSLDGLNLKQGYLAVAGELTIGTLSVAGSGFRVAYSDTLLGGGTANLTIDGLSGTGGYIQAVGAGAVTDVMASKDPGEIYQTMDGGELVFAPTPNAASSFWLNQGGGGGDVGTIAFEKPGATIAAPLWEIGAGSSIELPGTAVSQVVFGASLQITTNLGTTTFSSPHYLSGALAPGGWTAAFDPETGLERITFTAAPHLTSPVITSDVHAADGPGMLLPEPPLFG